MKNIQMFCKITNFDLPDLDDFDQYQGFPLKHSNSTSSYLFSARNPSSLLISSEIPIENKQIEINFHQESDLIDFSNSNLEKYEIISFDRIFTCFDSQESLFLNSCKDLVRKLMDGQNSGYLLNGSSW